MFEKEIYVARREELRKRIKSGIIILLGNSEASSNYPHNTYHFRQDSTFLYYFGLNNADFVGVLDADAGTDCIYGNDYTMDDIIWMGNQPSLQTLAESVGVRKSYPLGELQKTVNSALRQGRKIHFLPPYRLVNTKKLSDLLGIAIDRVKDYVSQPLIEAIVAMREVKSDLEIAQIDNACDIGYMMHTQAMKMCRPGIMEREIAGAIEGIALQHGQGVSFHSIVTQNGQTLHNHYHGNKLESGRLLLVDAGAENVMNYCSDFTRTLPISGKYTTKQKEIYDLVLAANLHSQELAKPGITYRSVHISSITLMAEGLISLGLMKGNAAEAVESGAMALFMPHGLGHQMGLDVHDMEDFGENNVGYDLQTTRSTQFGLSGLRIGKQLKEGHVLTTEPGLYFIPALISKWENEKINTAFINYDKVKEYLDFGGIRLEEDILITKTGNRRLGKHQIPLQTQDVEEMMARGAEERAKHCDK